jgi:hypothetical protein
MRHKREFCLLFIIRSIKIESMASRERCSRPPRSQSACPSTPILQRDTEDTSAFIRLKRNRDFDLVASTSFKAVIVAASLSRWLLASKAIHQRPCTHLPISTYLASKWVKSKNSQDCSTDSWSTLHRTRVIISRRLSPCRIYMNRLRRHSYNLILQRRGLGWLNWRTKLACGDIMVRAHMNAVFVPDLRA